MGRKVISTYENALFGTEDTPKNVYTDFVGDILGITVSQDIKDRIYLMNPKYLDINTFCRYITYDIEHVQAVQIK
jgi:hypothetical protein